MTVFFGINSHSRQSQNSDGANLVLLCDILSSRKLLIFSYPFSDIFANNYFLTIYCVTVKSLQKMIIMNWPNESL